MGGGNIELVCSQLDDIWEADDRTERGKKNNEEQHGDGILKSTNIEITAQKNEKSSRRCEMSMERALKRTQKKTPLHHFYRSSSVISTKHLWRLQKYSSHDTHDITFLSIAPKNHSDGVIL